MFHHIENISGIPRFSSIMKGAVVGSTNPVKINAVREILDSIFGDVHVEGIYVPSGISRMPTSPKEAIKGAENRALKAMEKGDYDMAFGIEGFTQELEQGMFLSRWSVAMDREGKMGYGCSHKFQLPSKIAKSIRAGSELGPIMDVLTGEEGVSRERGAIGVFTRGTVTRNEAAKQSVICSLTRFLSPELYQ